MFLVYFFVVILFFLPIVEAQLRSSGFVFNVPQLTVDGSEKQYNFSMALSNAPNSQCTVFLLTEFYSLNNCTLQFNNSNWDQPVQISAVPYSLFSNFSGPQLVPIRLRSFCQDSSPFHNIEGMLPTIRSANRGVKASVTGSMNIIPFGQSLPYSYQSPGFYYLLRSPYLTIQSLTSTFMGSSVVMTGLFVRYGDYVFAIDPAVADKSKAVVEITPQVPRTFRILNSKTGTSDAFNINFPDGSSMVVDVVSTIINGQSLSYLNLFLELPSSYRNMVGGLLGGFFDTPSQTFYTSFGGFIPPTSVYSAANADTTGAFSLNFLRSFAESWRVPNDDNINLCRNQCSNTNVALIDFPFRECGVVNFAFAPNPTRVLNYVIGNLASNPATLFSLPPPVDPFAQFPTSMPPVNVVPSVNVQNFNPQSMNSIAAQQQQITPMGFAQVEQFSPFRGIVAPNPLPQLPVPNAELLTNATRFCTTRIQPIVGSNVDTTSFIRSCEIDIRRQMNPDTVANFYALQYTRMASRSILSMTAGQNQNLAQAARELAKTYDFGNFTCRSNCRLCAVEGCVLCMSTDMETRQGLCVPVQQRFTSLSPFFPTSSNVLLPPTSTPVATSLRTSAQTSPTALTLATTQNQMGQATPAVSTTGSGVTPASTSTPSSVSGNNNGNNFVVSTVNGVPTTIFNTLQTVTASNAQPVFVTTTMTVNNQVITTEVPVSSQNNDNGSPFSLPSFLFEPNSPNNPTGSKSILDIPIGQLLRGSSIALRTSLESVAIFALTALLLFF